VDQMVLVGVHANDGGETKVHETGMTVLVTRRYPLGTDRIITSKWPDLMVPRTPFMSPCTRAADQYIRPSRPHSGVTRT